MTHTFTFPIGHAVWFPDIDLTSKRLGFSTNLKGLTLDASALPGAEQAIEKLFEKIIGHVAYGDAWACGYRSFDLSLGS